MGDGDCPVCGRHGARPMRGRRQVSDVFIGPRNRIWGSAVQAREAGCLRDQPRQGRERAGRVQDSRLVPDDLDPAHVTAGVQHASDEQGVFRT